MIKLLTIGFTNKSAQKFFELLKKNDVSKIVDTRINNTSQLSGFAKGSDLAYFAKEVGNMDYLHKIDFAPTKELLEKYRKGIITWEEYEPEYLNLLDIRKVGNKINVEELHQNCLLCSEHTPEKCHRRLLAEYIKARFNNVEIIHLVK